MFGNQNQEEQKSCFDFVLEFVPHLMCTPGSFLLDTGYEGGPLETWVNTERSHSYHCHLYTVMES